MGIIGAALSLAWQFAQALGSVIEYGAGVCGAVGT